MSCDRPRLRLPVCAAVALLSAVSGASDAQERPSSLDMTCRQAARLVSARGALVLGTGGFTYDRFVRDRSFCEPTEVTANGFAPTRDNPECLVGYRCIEPGRDWFGDDE
ncbi:hypothetical protein [Methylobacterium nodulans]|uniref:YARHG domain-containing protein n=1 Tax=Methylobacterium nodulans (strain LMG 21967 / CNCM I-2342 / ORS 2060) TaxID=460265 RepID=B8IFY8_METNO|nr:hypothetical protein [Methylobacterium nodulans]ACL59698.1 conserved hypothetical protein [Methylobacterium nodulans ORS 2060]